MALRAISLCSGYGGLELGVRLARPDLRVVGAVERQAYAASVLASRMVEDALDSCPIWDDLESFDGRAYRDRVDLVIAGFPCQGASVAGKRRGINDKRWLFPHVLRITRECGASLLFLENVPGLLNVNGGGAFAEILDSLAACGWVAEWDCVPAAAVGAPHLRDRLFLFAADANRVAVRVESERDQRKGRSEGAAERGDAEPLPARRARDASDADSDGSQGIGDERQLDEGARAQQRDHFDRCGLSPRWSRIVGRMAPEPAIRRMDDGDTGELDGTWNEEILLLGNGVVPQAAARAFAHLESRLIQ